MPDKDASTPRLFLVRHGETEWSQSGRHTGKTEIPLTPHGELQVNGTAQIAVGAGKLVNPAKLAKVLVSPRIRAQKTAELLFGEKAIADLKAAEKLETDDRLQEWDYGYVFLSSSSSSSPPKISFSASHTYRQEQSFSHSFAHHLQPSH